MKWVAGDRIRSRVETGSLQLSLFDFKGEAHGDIDAIRTNGRAALAGPFFGSMSGLSGD
jgi:hypothetical protein